MGPLQYCIGYLRVLFSLGLYGWLAFLVAVALGIGASEDYGPIRKSLNPIYNTLVAADMPPNLPWLFIAASFVVIALVRLVHRHVMWEATLPRLEFSAVKTAPGPLETETVTGGVSMTVSEHIVLVFIEVSNKPRSRVGGKAAEDAWVTALFENEKTNQIREVRYCRWEGNPKPRKDYFMTEKQPRYQTEWNVRTLPPNGMPHRIDFCIFKGNGAIFGFSGPAQEVEGWAAPDLKLWPDVPIKVTISIQAANLQPNASHSFRLMAGKDFAVL